MDAVRLTQRELQDAMSLLSTQLYRRAGRNLARPEEELTASVTAEADGPVLRMRLSLEVVSASVIAGPVAVGADAEAVSC